MTRIASRRLGLVLVGVALAVAFVWSEVHGQAFRPPRPPFPPPPRFNPPVLPGPIGPPVFEFTCTNCGKVVGKGKSHFDAPASCPFCGVRFINGGFGNSNPPNGGNPAMPGGNTLPTQPPPAVAPPIQPVNTKPAVTPAPKPPVVEAPSSQPPVDSSRQVTTTTSTSGDGPKAWVVILVSGIAVIGLAGLAGGIWMLATSGGRSKAPRRRRRPRYDD